MEGKNHTARKGVLSGVQNTTRQSLDVRSWQGLTEVLKRARESGMDDESYAAFRDTVLAYAQSGGEETLRSKIEETIAQLPDVPLAPRTEEHAAPVPPAVSLTPKKQQNNLLGSSRPRPEFKASTVKTTTLPSIKKVEKPIASHDEVSVQPTSVSARKLPVQTATVPQNLPTGAGVPQVEERSATSVAIAESSIVEKTKEAPLTSTEESPAPDTGASSPINLSEAKARITEIKHEVNSKVGNPGALIDDGNTIGKDYINALLAAMKASAGGEVGSLEIAMARLEKSYELVMQFADRVKKEAPKKVIETKVETVSELQVKPTAEAVTNTLPTQGEKHQESKVTVAPRIVEDFEKKKKASFAALKERVAASKIEKEAGEQVSGIHRENVVPASNSTVEVSTADALAEKPPEQATQPAQSQVVVPQKVNTAQMPAAQSSIPSLADRLKGMVPSVSKAISNESSYSDQPKTMQKLGNGSVPFGAQASAENVPTLPMSSALETLPTQSANTPSIPNVNKEVQHVSEHQDDIYSEKVTKSLEQLLDEWDLFSKGGFLGMGPSGIHHPLYQKLSELTMFSVTSGRFEGATPDIRQSLMDYINAWRYEQGISFSPTETFEHYLRRVLSRIIKRQGG